MNRKYLGDALDFWKGALLDHLVKNGALKNLLVDPMITDEKPWKPGGVETSLYAMLLRLDESQILLPGAILSRQRAAHFADVINHSGDLFIDPDTGIQTGNRNSKYHVNPGELYDLLISHSTRVVAVYQHIRGKTRDRVIACVKRITEEVAGLHWCSYESATVAMLFFCHRHDRIDHIESSLEKLYPQTSPERVFKG